MDEATSKIQILEAIRVERSALEATISGLSESQMTRKGVEGSWSIKDILAHIAEWERKMVRWIEESQRGEVPERPAPGQSWDELDQINEQIYRKHRDRSLGAVLQEYRSAHQAALACIRDLSEEDLFDPQRYAWRGGDPMWHMVAANTWWHDREHRETIEGWLEAGEKG